jgi:hypothetical protein
MSAPVAQFFVTTSQSQPQLVLQLLQVGEFALDIGQLLFRTVPHGRTWL